MEILALKGLVLGFIYSVALVAGTVWCVQVTLRSGFLAGIYVAAALALAQGTLGGLATLALYGLLMLPVDASFALRLMAILVFLYMSFKMFTAPKAKTLQSDVAKEEPRKLFSMTFALSVTMPMRLGGYLSFAIASGLPHHGISGVSVPFVALAVCLGSSVWFVYIVILARIFGHRVSESISLISINKLNGLSGVVFLLVALITAIPLLVEI
ncbi:MAG: LysE family transporter [Puniceicoccales bacterium]